MSLSAINVPFFGKTIDNRIIFNGQAPNIVLITGTNNIVVGNYNFSII